VGILEGSLQVVGESVEAGSAGSLVLASSLGSLLLESGNAGSLSGLNSLGLSGAESLGSWVESLHHSAVLEWVLLLLVVSADGGSDFSELALDLVGVDDSGEVGAVHHVSAELESTLLDTLLAVGTEDLVEGFEGVLGEDDESSEVTTWGELEQVESVDGASVDTWEVTSGLLDKWVLISVDDQRSLLENEAGASQFANTGTSSLVVTDTGEVIGGTSVHEGGKESLGGLNVEAVEDERQLWDLLDSVTTSLDEWSAGRGGESGGNGVSLLVGVDLSVPLSPDSKWGEHASLTAHVTEGSLSGSVGTRS